MQLSQTSEPFRIPALGLRREYLRGKLVELAMNSFDRPVGRLLVAACIFLRIEPHAESALALIERRRGVTFALEKGFKSCDPCAVLY